MFSCSTCMERYVQSLAGKPLLSSTSARTTVATTLAPEQLSRRYVSNGGRPNGGRRFDNPSKGDDAPMSKDRLLATGGVALRRKEYKLEVSMGNVLKKHPEYANDPLKLAEYTRKALRGDDYETALAVVRAASKSLPCTVSWNHLIDWQMSKGRMNAALKTYNEMKKRGQQPDAHTFTIIISGCTNHKDLPAALGKVLAIYTAMSNEKSVIKPNTIHLNAIIKMCARARDIDAMFGIMSQMPTRGISAPNNLTYTTMLNALRVNATADSKDPMTSDHNGKNYRKATLDARKLWQDVIARWRKGDMWIDEELVCAMGRLLLLGDVRDQDDILSLIEQTMNIPRQVPKLGTSNRKAIDPSSQGQAERGAKEGEEKSALLAEAAAKEETAEIERAIIQDLKTAKAVVSSPNAPMPSTKPAAKEETVETEESIIQALKAARAVDSFASLSPPNATMPSKTAYAKPGRNSLSLVMDVLLKLQLKGPAYDYWDIFVRKIGVVPDSANYHGYLRILRTARASTETVALLESMKPSEMRAATFRIAMSSCTRDKNNPNAFRNAGKILDIMTNALQVPDVPVLINYLQVSTSNLDHMSQSKLDMGKQILRALSRLGPSFINIKAMLTFGPPSSVEMTKFEQEEYRTSVIMLVRKMIGAYDMLMDQGLVDRDTYSKYTAERSKLAAFAQRREPYNKPVGTFEVPQHLSKFIDRHRLNKAMVRAQSSPEKWESFLARVQKDYEAESDSKTKAEESKSTQEAERLAEEERQFAELMVKQDPGTLFPSLVRTVHSGER